MSEPQISLHEIAISLQVQFLEASGQAISFFKHWKNNGCGENGYCNMEEGG